MQLFYGVPEDIENIFHPIDVECGECQKAINKMVYEIHSILSDCELSMYLYGSSVLDDFRLGWSDIDILVLTDRQISEEQAQKLVKLRQTMLVYPAQRKYYCEDRRWDIFFCLCLKLSFEFRGEN